MADKTFDLSILFKMVDRFSKPMQQSMHSFNQYIKKTKEADTVTKRFGNNVKNIGQNISGIGAKLTAGITLPLTLLAKSSIGVARDFEASMNMVGAVTRTKIGGEATPAFEKLKETAKRLGAETIFTTQQVADGMQVLGLKGLQVNEIFGVMPKVLQLATSAQMDIASAADIVTSIMNSQKMGIEDLTKVNDTLVSAFTRSSADLASLGVSFKYAGNITRVTGLSIQEAASAMAFMAKQGFIGEMAGTAMRTGMVKLAAPSKQMINIMKELGVNIYQVGEDGKVKLLPFLEVLREFERAGADAVKMTELLGLRAGPGFATLLGMSDEIEKLVKLMGEDVGIAARVAQTQMTGLPKILAELAAAWEIVRIAFMESDFGKWVQDALGGLTEILRKIANTNPDILAMAAGLMTVAAVVGPLVGLFGVLVASIGAIVASPVIAATLGAIAAAFITISTAVGFIVANLDKIKEFFKSITEPVMGFFWDLDKKLGLEASTSKSGDFGANPNILNNRGKTDINIKVSSEEGTTAKVENIKQVGDDNVSVINESFLGFGAAFGQ